MYPDIAGDIFVDDRYFNNLEDGSFGFRILVHEIGHAIGLSHPDGDGLNGLSLTDEGLGEYQNGWFTIMETENRRPSPLDDNRIFGWQATPMPLDILAVQAMYGANHQHNTGNDIYYFREDTAARTIWDAGGIDRIDASAAVVNLEIDLTPGSLIYGEYSILAIAFGVRIEQATGGPMDDVIIGSDANNRLLGLTGNDEIHGEAGNDWIAGADGLDRLFGGDGFDVIYGNAQHDEIDGGGQRDFIAGGTGDDRISGGEGNDRIYGNSGDDEIDGGSGADLIAGGLGDDQLLGAEGNDRLLGNLGDDHLDGGSGADQMVGGLGNDTYWVESIGDEITEQADSGFDTLIASVDYRLPDNVEIGLLTGQSNLKLTGSLGPNTLHGNEGDNRLVGLSGNDQLFGAGGDDRLYGNFGDDHLDGGPGADWLFGGAGNDFYVLDAVDEVDRSLSDAGVDTVSIDQSYTLGNYQENLVLRGDQDLDGIGNAANNVIAGGDGNDWLDGSEGSDRLLGGAGNDFLLFEVADTEYTGGTGNDTLLIRDEGVFFDNRVGPLLDSIEVIDLSASADSNLLLDPDLLTRGAIRPFDLQIIGGPDDYVSLTGSWIDAGKVSVDDTTFVRLLNDNLDVLVPEAINLNYASRAAPGTINLDELPPEDGFVVLSNLPNTITRYGNVDINHDGFSDVFLEASREHNVWFILGAPDNSFPVDTDSAQFGSQLVRIDIAGGEIFQDTAATFTDINGDARNDLIVGIDRGIDGSILFDAGPITFDNGIRTISSTEEFPLAGVPYDRGLSERIIQLGDIDGDGIDDLAQPRLSGGMIIFVRGDTSFPAPFVLEDTEDLEAYSTVFMPILETYPRGPIGDVNGDGIDDLLFNSPRWGIQAQIVLGANDTFDLLAIDDARLETFSSTEIIPPGDSSINFPIQERVFDFNDDGFSDVLVSSAGNKTAGEAPGVSVIFGSNKMPDVIDLNDTSSEAFFTIESNLDYRFFSGIGDFDGDGFDDLAIQDNDIHIVFGRRGPFRENADLADLNPDNVLKISTQHDDVLPNAAGDVNGDGYDDLLLIDKYHGGDGVKFFVVFGRDHAGNVKFEGSADDDVFMDNDDSNILIGGLGNDTLDGAGGADVVKGAHGDDVIIYDPDDRKVEGDAGTDTLRFLGDNQVPDLTAIPNGRITGIERIDLTGSGDNTLVLSALDLFNLSETTNVFRVDGNAGDTVQASDGRFVAQAGDAVNIEGELYTAWTAGPDTLLIDMDITQIIT